MARIPLVDPDGGHEGEAASSLLAQLDGGVHPNVFRAILNHPKAAEAFGGLGRLLYLDSSITPAQRELAYLTASFLNRCHY